MLVNVQLPRLTCVSEADGSGSQPYLWTDLLFIYEGANQLGVQEADRAATPVGAEAIIAHGMKVGDAALIPTAIGSLGTQIPAGLAGHQLLLVAVLWDQKGTPAQAVQAGYDAFLQTLYDQVSTHLAGLAEDPKDTSTEIQTAVNQAVSTAITAQLSLLEKLGIWLGVDHTDTSIGGDFASYSPADGAAAGTTATPLTLIFNDGKGNHYEIAGQWNATVDPCEQELIAFDSAKQALTNAQGALRQLQATENLTLEQEQEVAQLTKQVLRGEAAVKSTQQAYDQCQTQHGPPHAPPHVPPVRVGATQPLRSAL